MGYVMENFYTHIKGSTKDQFPYPNENLLNIKLPARIALVGPSGCGKTTTLINLIKGIGIWQKIVILAKIKDEPLYKLLTDKIQAMEKKLKIQMLLVIDTVDDLPDPSDFDPKECNLVIFDDMLCESKKSLARIEQYFIYGRKYGVTSCFLSQNYYGIPQKIRQNCNYFIIKQISKPMDLTRLLKDCNLGDLSIEQLKHMYKWAVSQGDPLLAFFMIDTSPTVAKALRIRANFAGIDH